MNLNHTMEGLPTCQGNPSFLNTNKLANGEWGRENKYPKKDSADTGAASSRKDVNSRGNSCTDTDSSETEVSSERTTYVKGKFLGKGGFAHVHELLDLSTRIIYAGKIIPKNRITKPHHIQKIAREISIHRNLVHKNVVRLHHFFEDKVNAYIVLENCPRKSLFHVLKHRYSVTEPEARFYLRQLAEGVKYIHTQKVIHRDLKPGNMLLTEDMTVKLGDFGLATLADGNKKGSLCGTPNYMAPEVLKKLSYSYEADVWAMGCILYAMLVGQPPFETASLKETYTRIVNNKYTIPLQLSESARKLIRQLLHPQPESRILIDKIGSHEFFKNGYTPTTLSALCCFTAPVFSSNNIERHIDSEPMETSATPLPRTSVAATILATSTTCASVTTTSTTRACRTTTFNTTTSMPIITNSVSSSVHASKVISTSSRTPSICSSAICSTSPSVSTSFPAASSTSTVCSLLTTCNTLTVSSVPFGVVNLTTSAANDPSALTNTDTTCSTMTCSSIATNSNCNKTGASVTGNVTTSTIVDTVAPISTTITISILAAAAAAATTTSTTTTTTTTTTSTTSTTTLTTTTTTTTSTTTTSTDSVTSDVTTITTTAATTATTAVTATTAAAMPTSVSATTAAAAAATATTTAKTTTSLISSFSSNSASNAVKSAECNLPVYKHNVQKNAILTKMNLKQKFSNVLCPDKVGRKKENNSSSMYDVVVGCLKTMPPSPDKIQDNSSEGICCPIFVSKWIDYSNKYGFGFQLSDRSVGVLFNDNTRISFSSDRSQIEFHDVNGKITSHPHHAVPEPLHERLALLEHFSHYMQENLTDGGYVTNRGNHKQKFPILQMKRWVRTNTAIVMELTNGTLQINFFQDHTKIILSAGKLGFIVTYINCERQSSSYWIHQIAQTGSEKSIYNRLKFAAAVLREFAELDDGKV